MLEFSNVVFAKSIYLLIGIKFKSRKTQSIIKALSENWQIYLKPAPVNYQDEFKLMDSRIRNLLEL